LKITSSQNESFKHWKDLVTSKGVRENQQFILSGEKIIKEFLSWPNDHEARLKFKILAEIYPETGRTYTFNEIKKFELSNHLFKELDVVGTNFNLLILEFPAFAEWNPSTAPKGLEVLCPLGDPGNSGALVRSALAFGASQVLLTKESCHPFHPRALKASAGASLLMVFALTKLSLKELKPQSWDYLLNQHGKDLQKFQWPKNLRLWVGEEGPGFSDLSKDNPAQVLSLKTNHVESLNATVAASIAIYEWSRSKN